MSFLIELCKNYDFLMIIKFIWTITKVFFIIVPIIAILMISISFAKGVLESPEEMSKTVNIVIKKIISCVVVFLVPIIVKFSMGLLGQAGLKYADCLNNSLNEEYMANLKGEMIQHQNTNTNTNTNDIGNENTTNTENTTSNENNSSTNSDTINNDNNLNNSTNNNKSNMEKGKSYTEITVLKDLKESDLKNKVNVIGRDGCIAAQSFVVMGNYYITSQSKSTNDKNLIQVINKKTGKKVNDFFDNFHHSSGMTYNSRTGKIYISRGGDAKEYYTFDASNITKVKSINKTTKTLSKNIKGMAYDNSTNQFYISSMSEIYIYNSNFKLLKTIKKLRNHTRQDIGAYKGIIMVVFYQPIGHPRNAIDLYRASDGGYIGTYNLDIPGLELESIDYYGTGNTFSLFFGTRGKKDLIYTTDAIDLY